MHPTENKHRPKPISSREALRLVAVDGEIIADQLARVLGRDDPRSVSQSPADAAPQPRPKRRWRRVFLQSLIEGFALIGAAAYPSEYFFTPSVQETLSPKTQRPGHTHIRVSLARRLLESGVYFE